MEELKAESSDRNGKRGFDESSGSFTDVIDVEEKRIDDNEVPLGIKQIDRDVVKGISTGSICSFVSNPMVETDLILKQMAYTGRPIKYFTGFGEKDRVVDNILDMPSSRDIDVECFRYSKFNDIGSVVQCIKREMDDGCTVVFDFASRFFDKLDDPEHALSEINRLVYGTSSVVFFNFQRDNPRELKGIERYVVGVSRYVFYLEIDFNKSNIEVKLSVPKAKGMKCINDVKTMELSDYALVSNSERVS